MKTIVDSKLYTELLESDIEGLHSRIAELEEAILERGIEMGKSYARIAELEATVEIHADISNAYEKLISEIVSLSNKANAKLHSRIAELEAAQRWIPVSERLPEEDETCLVISDKSVVMATYFVKEHRWEYLWWTQSTLLDVTHWMPLPQPPEVQE